MLASPTLPPPGSFWPPRCPNDQCAQSSRAGARGFFRHGYYVTRHSRRPIPRFICRLCRRTMSSQTFDHTYRLRRPELEDAILKEIRLGASMRRVAKVLGINRKTVSRRLHRARSGASAAATAVAEPQDGRLSESSISRMRS